jgi:hypothetical protein
MNITPRRRRTRGVVGPRREDQRMTKTTAVLAAALATAAIAGAATAGADPTPPPSPGYQILTPDGPQFPGNQIYPPRCAHNMYGCGFRYDPGSGTWNPSDPGGV